MREQLDNQKGFSPVILAIIVLILTALVVGGGVFWWQNLKDFKKAQERPLLPETSPAVPTPTPTADPYAGWLTYTNDVYDYEFRYPREASVIEVEQNAFSLSPEEVSAGMTFEDKFLRYTGKICLTVTYNLGYVQISSPPNEGFAHVICGRTGRAYEGPNRSESLTVDGRSYTASGFEEQGPGETLNFHNETLVVTLDDGTRIEYGSRPDESATFADYLEMREEILRIVESFRKTS